MPKMANILPRQDLCMHPSLRSGSNDLLSAVYPVKFREADYLTGAYLLVYFILIYNSLRVKPHNKKEELCGSSI